MTRWTDTTGCEATFAMIKSHAIAYTGEIFDMIVRNGFIIVAARKGELSGQEINELYFEHIKKPHYTNIVRSVSGLVVPMVLVRPHAVRAWRDILSETDP